MPKLFKLNQKGAGQIFVFLFLVIGLVVAVYLVRTETNLFSKADEPKSCNNFVVKNRICGQDAYTNCSQRPVCKLDPVTKKMQASYECSATAEQNPNCSGVINCAKDDYMCDERNDVALDVSASAVCVPGGKSQQNITASWGDVSDFDPALSYKVELQPVNEKGDVTGIIGTSSCLNAKAISSRAYTFPQSYPTGAKYRVFVSTYPDVNCGNNGVVKHREVDVKNANCSQ